MMKGCYAHGQARLAVYCSYFAASNSHFISFDSVVKEYNSASASYFYFLFSQANIKFKT